MSSRIEIAIAPEFIHTEAHILAQIRAQLKLSNSKKDFSYSIVRKSLDARSSSPVFRLLIEVNPEQLSTDNHNKSTYCPVKGTKSVLIIGAGPAGYFAALKLIEKGIRPIILDRGKDVQERRRDLRAIQQFGEVDSNSNYCFGEGGAGTYSDGKLYTRSKKRGKIEPILRTLVDHGAQSDILIDAHPHIGSNKLPKVIANIRNTIEKNGGQVLFHKKVTDLIISEDRKLKGVLVNDHEEIFCDKVILATGHSARDIYWILHKNKIRLESKDFALGVRIEHPQALIDKIQYNQAPRHPNLPAASYALVTQVEDRGVFSFCMCPGGLIVPAATAPGELVVNGMSLSRRDSPFSNSGFVVAVEQKDLEFLDHNSFEHFKDPIFNGLKFQHMVEKTMFDQGDGSQIAPAQRLVDFTRNRISADLPKCSYIPGIYAAPMHSLLPDFIADRLKVALKIFDQKKKGYFTNEAIITGVESRTSAPIRIPRDSQTLMHKDLKGLFPCGEGAGFAGGIISAAIDGENVAKAVALSFE